MTTATLTARNLYAADATFRCGIAAWVEDRRCDLRLVDVLLEHGLEAAADCARWAATEPDRRVPNALGPHERKGACGPYPTQDDGDLPPEQSWFWRRIKDECCYAPDKQVPDTPHPHDSLFPTPTDAILWLLDNWKVT